MKSLFITLAIFVVFFGLPLAATLWAMYCYGKYRDAVPFTEEKERSKKSAIISAAIAGILDTVFFVCLFHYAFTSFFFQ